LLQVVAAVVAQVQRVLVVAVVRVVYYPVPHFLILCQVKVTLLPLALAVLPRLTEQLLHLLA